MDRPDSILLVGAAHLDRHGRCDDVPVPGASNPGRFAEMPGGAAFNVASSLAAWGADARLCSILGDDAGGRALRAAAMARGVTLEAQVSREHPTATYTAIVGPDGTLALALADMAIYDALDPATVAGVEDAPRLLVEANLSARAVAALLDRARGTVAAMTVSAAKAGRLRPVLARIDTLFTNRAELAALCEQPVDAPMPDLLHAFAALGGRGAVVSDGAGDVWTVAQGETRRHPVPPVPDIVDATGAGDALTAGTLMGLMTGRPLHEAIDGGIRAARAVLAVHGPWRADIEGDRPWT